MPAKYEVTDLGDVPTSEHGSQKRSGGCYVKTATGFLIGFLAITIAIGVGLIVHFAENRTLECVFPDQPSTGASGASQQQTGQGNTNRSTACPVCPPAPECKVCPPKQLPSAPLPTPSLAPSSVPQLTKYSRLPGSVIPTHYNLKIKPDIYGQEPAKFSFTGHVAIDLQCLEATDTIILHANSLQISNIELSGGKAKFESHIMVSNAQQLVIKLSDDLEPSASYTLSMDFAGPLTDDLRGLYLSTYTQGNETVYLATTQFESTDARKAFPCFDEPAMKATFKVTLTRKQHVMSLSNMPKEAEIPGSDDYVDDVYQRTVKMSTYLLAFVVGQFDHTENRTSSDLLYGAWARPESVEQTKLALDVGIKTIINYENYFDIPFPLPKQDMIALPDFRPGAMENWGLITYRESAMLYYEGVASEANRQRIETVITHELAHQWFGNLVTMEWWDDIWLNEGFAAFVQYLGVDFLHPEWKMFEQFVVSYMHEVFDMDSLVTSHPIYGPVNTPADMHAIFDFTAYAKGASIIRMMRFVLGEGTFKTGLTRYLNKHKWANANHTDLWTAWQEQSLEDHPNNPVDVAGVMDTWTLQMNYPVVHVSVQNGHLIASQSRFLHNKDAKDPEKYVSPFEYKWRIPFTFTTSQNENQDITNADIHWLDTTSKDLGPVDLTVDDWVLGNVGVYGYYRVTYDMDNWKALTRQLKRRHKFISTVNRAQIINDAWSLSRAGDLSTSIALDTLDYLDTEREYVPWEAAFRQIGYLEKMLRKTEIYGQFQDFMKTKLTPAFNHFGMDDTDASHIESLLRGRLAEMACSYGVDKCIGAATTLFENWMDDPDNNPIDPDLRPAVYCTAIAEGGSKEWDFTFEKYKQEKVVTEKITLSKALACTRHAWLLSSYLELTTNAEVIRKQDATSVIHSIADNPIGEMLAWDFMRQNWNYLHNEYGSGVFSFRTIVEGITASFNTEFQLAQLKEFIDGTADIGVDALFFDQAVEKTEMNIKWLNTNKGVIENWLKDLNTQEEIRVKDIRLPTHLVPFTYDVTINPDIYGDKPEDFNFKGNVKIHVTATTAAKNVTLHTKYLNITESSIKFGTLDGSAGPRYNGQREYDSQREFAIFYLTSNTSPGQNYFIQMDFAGHLKGNLDGLYLSQYKRGEQTVYLATTQMEPTSARKAFPCFDEPHLKATFNVSLVRRNDMVALSNMPIDTSTEMEHNMVKDTFQTTAKMSTYLLAFIVCDFTYKEGITTSGTRFRVWSRPESINQTDLALYTGVETLTYYEDLFGEPYPLPKQDMVAIPDFSAGAMENWGLITYRETALLYEPGVSSEGNKESVTTVITHELAHQWFGNLVTMKWWDDLWLNEGFATFIEDMGADHLYPEWRMKEMATSALYAAFSVDDMPNVHPIYVPDLYTSKEINSMFDTITYSKGGSVIRMLKFFLGNDIFMEGLHDYIQTKKYSNADHNDLWNALAKAAERNGNTIPVVDVMNTWILQMNYPVVTVKKTDAGHIKVHQERFLVSADAKDPGIYPSPYNYTWKIPFTYTTESDPNFDVTHEHVIWFENTEMEMPAHQYPDGWIMGNIQQYGVYVVNYDVSNWEKLIQQLKTNHKVISIINRAQLMKDSFSLANAKKLPFKIALQTTEYLDDEEEYIPWKTGRGQLTSVGNKLKGTEIYGAFRRFFKAKLEKQFQRLTMNNTGATHLDSYLRSAIANAACYYDNEDCIQEAKNLFQTYKANTDVNPIDPGLKSTVYCTAVREGGEDEWQFVFDRYMISSVPSERLRFLNALSCTRKPWILNRLLNLALNGSVIRFQDVYWVFSGVGSNSVGASLTWDFVNERIEDIRKALGSISYSLISGVYGSFNTDYQLEKFKTFAKQYLDTNEKRYQQVIDGINYKKRWMEDNYDTMKEWLAPYI